MENEKDVGKIIARVIIIGFLAMVALIIFSNVTPFFKDGSGSVNSSDDTDVETKIESAVIAGISIPLSNYNYGKSESQQLFLRETTFATVKSLDNYNLQYQVYGKQYFEDVFGTRYVTNYSAKVFYNSDINMYQANVEFGTIEKE